MSKGEKVKQKLTFRIDIMPIFLKQDFCNNLKVILRFWAEHSQAFLETSQDQYFGMCALQLEQYLSGMSGWC